MSIKQLDISDPRGHVFLVRENAMGVTVGKCIACDLPVLSEKGVGYDCPNEPDA